MTKACTGSERRKYPRANEKVQVLYCAGEGVSLGYLSEVRNSATRNISGGGICFETEIYIPPNSILEVQVNKTIDDKLGIALPIHADAKVTWIKQIKTGRYRLGLQFTDINEGHQEEIIKNVKEKLKEKKDAQD
jgi:c-di-GMP-binding flagellar brake protein YcgR